MTAIINQELNAQAFDEKTRISLYCGLTYHIFNKIAIGWAMKQVNCRSCGRLLAKIGNFNDLEIKCPRCKAFNVLSVKNALSEVLRDSSTGNLDEQSTSQSTPTICGAKTNVFKRISQNFG